LDSNGYLSYSVKKKKYIILGTNSPKNGLAACPQCKIGQLMIIRSPITKKRFIGCSNYNTGCKASSPLLQKARLRATKTKCEFCNNLGADAAINYREQDFSEEIKRLTEGKGVNVILDMVGGPYFPKNIRLLADEGRLVQIALMQGSKAEVDFRSLLLKRVTLTGSTLRPRSVEEKTKIAQALQKNVWPLLESGAIRPIIHQTFPLKQASEAHRLMESSAHIGKILLKPAD